MKTLYKTFLALVTLLTLHAPAHAQNDDPMVFATVHRPPFAVTDSDEITGFSIQLMREIARQIDRDVVFEPIDRFGDMLTNVRAGRVDGAIANISITAERERAMDFSQPIFGSGIQILVPTQLSVSDQFLGYLGSEALVFLIGATVLVMIGWAILRLGPQQGPAGWSGGAAGIALMVSGGALLLTSAGIITARVTVNALQTQVQSMSDLENRSVGTIAGSTSSDYLVKHGVSFSGYGNLDALLEAFERDDINAVVFDGPILAYYAQNDGRGSAQLIEKVYQPENYGILMPAGSPLKEVIDLALLELREDGTYEQLLTKWFGNSYSMN